MPDEFKQYLGDAVYVRFDGFYIWLETSNGMRVTNKIALDAGVWHELIAWKARLDKAQKEQTTSVPPLLISDLDDDDIPF